MMTILNNPNISEQLRAIDIQFTKQILAYETQAQTKNLDLLHLELAAVLVNMALGKGQTCLPLHNIEWLSAYPLLAKEWNRSEERRVGKECRSRWSPDHERKEGEVIEKW